MLEWIIISQKNLCFSQSKISFMLQREKYGQGRQHKDAQISLPRALPLGMLLLVLFAVVEVVSASETRL